MPSRDNHSRSSPQSPFAQVTFGSARLLYVSARNLPDLIAVAADEQPHHLGAEGINGRRSGFPRRCGMTGTAINR